MKYIDSNASSIDRNRLPENEELIYKLILLNFVLAKVIN
jgi:hypothetical protein